MENGNLNLNYTNPIVAVDGQSVLINEEGPVTLVFFQVRKQTAQGVDADAVASVRLHSIEELKRFQNVIEETIKQHESREP